MFGSGSVTRVTSFCLAGTEGLGGPGDSAGFLSANLQVARALANVCTTCALGLGDSRRCRQRPPRLSFGTLRALRPGQCDYGLSRRACGYCPWMRTWPLYSWLRSRFPFWVPSQTPRSDLTAVAEPGTRFLFLSVGQVCHREGRSGRCSSARAHRAKEAALRPPGRPAPNSRPTPVKTEAKSGASPELPQDTAVLGKRCSPSLPSGSHSSLPPARRRPAVGSHGPLLSPGSSLGSLTEDFERFGTLQP